MCIRDRFGKDAVAFLLPLVTAVCMSAFLLVPTAYALAGKREAAQAPSLAALLTPDFYDFRLFYNSYGIGLTAFAAAALLAGCCWKKAENRIPVSYTHLDVYKRQYRGLTRSSADFPV